MTKIAYVGDPKYSPEAVAKNNAEVRASATPEMRDVLDQAQAAIDEENANMDARLDGETKLRAWAADLLGVQTTVSEISDLRDMAAKAKSGAPFVFSVFKQNRGKREIVEVTLFKTSYGTVVRLDGYIHALESTIIDLTNKVSAKDKFTDESFFGLIKLAFKRLSTGAKREPTQES